MESALPWSLASDDNRKHQSGINIRLAGATKVRAPQSNSLGLQKLESVLSLVSHRTGSDDSDGSVELLNWDRAGNRSRHGNVLIHTTLLLNWLIWMKRVGRQCSPNAMQQPSDIKNTQDPMTNLPQGGIMSGIPMQ